MVNEENNDISSDENYATPVKRQLDLAIALIGVFFISLVSKDQAAIEPTKAIVTVQKIDSATSCIPSIAPINLKLARLESEFGIRKHPIFGKKKMHKGIDFSLPKGAKVVATAPGIVIESTYDKTGGKGRYIVIQHDSIYSTSYFHLHLRLVKKGTIVKTRQLIGRVGNTGYSTGYHLHYEVHKNGVAVNPRKYISALNN